MASILKADFYDSFCETFSKNHVHPMTPQTNIDEEEWLPWEPEAVSVIYY